MPWDERHDGAPFDPRLEDSAFPSCSCSAQHPARRREIVPARTLQEPLLAGLPAVVKKVGHLVLRGYNRIKGICDTSGARGGGGWVWAALLS